ncbi:MAG: CHAP domain-containing protein [Actinobacteria bacterium]|nr:CHAP domain-containing protein [Actinomycetota bacterium]MCA1721303.1 CHAP domain-containing protein [Actinomycetota bacterium]
MRLARRLVVLLLSLLATSGLLVAPASAAGDDYPYRTSTTGANDRWGFTQRQCVSFVAWREAQARHSLNNATQHWGSALAWDETAARLGFRVSTRPVVGAIAQWNAGERSPWWASGSATANGTLTAGPYGHVGWVKQVNGDGSVVVEQYNMTGSRSYSASRLRAPRYIYYGVG